MSRTCTHVGQFADVTPSEGREDRLRIGGVPSFAHP
ncbi:MAG: hypothetical protein QOF40_2181 [Actinomycetota bacterium]|nr:hypothetical protein [Actinomycetota bacterium]